MYRRRGCRGLKTFNERCLGLVKVGKDCSKAYTVHVHGLCCTIEPERTDGMATSLQVVKLPATTQTLRF
jgi:hypothetical protein